MRNTYNSDGFSVHAANGSFFWYRGSNSRFPSWPQHHERPPDMGFCTLYIVRYIFAFFLFIFFFMVLRWKINFLLTIIKYEYLSLVYKQFHFEINFSIFLIFFSGHKQFSTYLHFNMNFHLSLTFKRTLNIQFCFEIQFSDFRWHNSIRALPWCLCLSLEEPKEAIKIWIKCF